jgi:hypothetical protein
VSLILAIIIGGMIYDYFSEQLYLRYVIPLRIFLLIALLVTFNLRGLAYSCIALGIALFNLADVISVYVRGYQGIPHQFVFNSVFKLFCINYGHYSGVSFLLFCGLNTIIAIHSIVLLLNNFTRKKQSS